MVISFFSSFVCTKIKIILHLIKGVFTLFLLVKSPIFSTFNIHKAYYYIILGFKKTK